MDKIAMLIHMLLQFVHSVSLKLSNDKLSDFDHFKKLMSARLKYDNHISLEAAASVRRMGGGGKPKPIGCLSMGYASLHPSYKKLPMIVRVLELENALPLFGN
jgi:hypothetical protein